MDAQFWLAKWKRNEIGFHALHAHPTMVAYFSGPCAPQGACVFVPLCGKSLDIHWLLKSNYRVIGVELSRLAVEQLFAELDIHPAISCLPSGVVVFEGPNIRIFVADIFSLTPDMLGSVDIVYDRAALVALPPQMAALYAHHLTYLTKSADQLLVCVEYDQERLSGPPFAVMAQDVERYYAQDYTIASIEHFPVANGIKGREPGYEHIWFLHAQKREFKK
ncbi:thiopurine S-methyltransferase [Acetobacter okinawensis]|uniref:thiopurine S-methyltransferase n=1 Tax=Acetobacter okinawensis TaxID=1076594 RepID=UPI00209DE33E|nr:thiopurine S-methyltransferase [Acetobacter okinawensis]MCP1212770.1 thiopurine S-methyltransferase [Acetobacter okinawensis]